MRDDHLVHFAPMDVELAVMTLKKALETSKIKSLTISREGNGFDKMPWSVIEGIFRNHFGKEDFEITVCIGEVEEPVPEKRNEIIHECHDSTAAGHRGEFKTYMRIRERYYRKGMRDEIRQYVQSCESFQNEKLTRVKTRKPMCITDKPIRSFQKVKVDIVGPLLVTESGNKYMLTWQDCFSKYSGTIPLSVMDAPNVAVALAEN